MKTCAGCSILFPERRYASGQRVKTNYCSRSCAHRHSPASLAYYARKRAPIGHTWMDNNGYIREKEYMGQVNCRQQHRIVMERSLGRKLLSHESVHHIDGNRANNTLENLQLMNGKHGKGQTYVCRACGSHDIVPNGINNLLPAA